MKIELICCLCAGSIKKEVDMGEWKEVYNTISSEMGFCPDHAIIEEFSDSQCPGCVGGWMDCPLWNKFAYSRRRTITEDDLKTIEAGVCPARVNGTFSFNTGKGEIENINISERSTTKSGIAFAKAIREYCEKYPSE